jgi:hypothetical protein
VSQEVDPCQYRLSVLAVIGEPLVHVGVAGEQPRAQRKGAHQVYAVATALLVPSRSCIRSTAQGVGDDRLPGAQGGGAEDHDRD